MSSEHLWRDLVCCRNGKIIEYQETQGKVKIGTIHLGGSLSFFLLKEENVSEKAEFRRIWRIRMIGIKIPQEIISNVDEEDMIFSDYEKLSGIYSLSREKYIPTSLLLTSSIKPAKSN